MVGLAFVFEAENGIRDVAVTGVQACALPICGPGFWGTVPGCAGGGSKYPAIAATRWRLRGAPQSLSPWLSKRRAKKIGRASCREKSVDLGGRRIIKKKKNH